MNHFKIQNLCSTREGDAARLSARVRWDGREREIVFRTRHEPTSTGGDPMVPAVLLPAMARKVDIELGIPVSEEMLLAAERVQALQYAWHPRWREAKVETRGGTSPAAAGPSTGAVGAFFSGGVDSFYTLQHNREEITHLIFVAGFDLPLHRHSKRELVMARMRETAAEIGLPLVEVETNLREFSDGLSFSWEEQHGAAMAAVAHFLAPGFDKILIPSSAAFSCLVPYGSHPALDPLWGSRSLKLVHDGEVTRFNKIASISSWETAVQNLRVCYRLVEGEYNCCHCTKCLWTMALLRACGALDGNRSFPLPLDLRALAEQTSGDAEQRLRMIQAIDWVESRQGDPALVDALRTALRGPRFSFRRAARSLAEGGYRRLRRFARRCWLPIKPLFARGGS